jgi:hypothetical protein
MYSQEEKDKEIEISCVFDIENVKDTFKKEYPNKKRDIKDYYFDQSKRCVIFGDRAITSFYTQTGVSQIDEWFSKQIRNGSKFTSKELVKMIRRNPHLHNVIKTNLLYNLTNYKNVSTY